MRRAASLDDGKFGTAILSVIAIIWVLRSRGAVAPWMLAGGLAYLTAVVITIAAAGKEQPPSGQGDGVQG